MKQKFKKLAKKAGFEFWGNEPWKPVGQNIDWSSDYDSELNEFGDLVVKDIAKWLKENAPNGKILAEKLLKDYSEKEEEKSSQ